MGRHRQDPLKRFWSYVEKRGPDECWPWIGCIDERDGYGRIWWNGKVRPAHLVMQEVMGLPPVDTKKVHSDHTCQHRWCVNLRHIRRVTPKVNALENNASPFARNAAAVDCLRGHPLSGPNLIVNKNGHRSCRTCYDMRRRGELGPPKKRDGWMTRFRRIAPGECMPWPATKDFCGTRKTLKTHWGIRVRYDKITAAEAIVTRLT